MIVDGASVTASISSQIVPPSGDWTEVNLLKVMVDSNSWAYLDDDGVSLSVVVSSDVTSGYRGTDSMNIEVRLDV